MEMKMGERRMEGAYEFAEILLQDGLVERWLDEGEQFPHTLTHTVAGWYLYHPQPSADDIVGVKMERRGAWMVLTLQIRRGKEVLAEFFNLHKNIDSHSSEEGVYTTCLSCGKRVHLPWDSFGYCGGPLVKAALRATDAEACPGSGALRRNRASNSDRAPVQP